MAPKFAIMKDWQAKINRTGNSFEKIKNFDAGIFSQACCLPEIVYCRQVGKQFGFRREVFMV